MPLSESSTLNTVLENQSPDMFRTLEYFRDLVMNSAGASLLLEYSEVLTAVLFVVMVAFLSAIFVRILLRRLTRKNRKWGVAFLSSLTGPLVTMIYVVGFTFVLEIFVGANQIKTIEISTTVRHLGIIFCLLAFSLRVIRKAEEQIIERIASGDKHALDATGTRTVTRLLRISLVAAAALTALSEAGISISGILAFGGVSGLAVGLAAKDPLANFFGSVMISLDRPFVEGDEIRSPDRSVEGFVEHIGWRITRIRTYNGQALYLPNSLFSTVIIENMSHMKLRYFDQVFGLRYEDINKIDGISRDIRELLVGHKDVDNEYLNIIVRKLSESTVDLAVEFYTHEVDYKAFTKVKEEILLAITEIIDKHGAEMPYPIQNLILQQHREEKKKVAPSDTSATLT